MVSSQLINYHKSTIQFSKGVAKNIEKELLVFFMFNLWGLLVRSWVVQKLIDVGLKKILNISKAGSIINLIAGKLGRCPLLVRLFLLNLILQVSLNMLSIGLNSLNVFVMRLINLIDISFEKIIKGQISSVSSPHTNYSLGQKVVSPSVRAAYVLEKQKMLMWPI